MPTFMIGKNTRVLFSNPTFTSATVNGIWATSSSTITINEVANVPLYVGMTVAATAAGLPSSTITAVSNSLTSQTITISGTTTSAATVPTTIAVTAPAGYGADFSQYFNDVSISRGIEATETTAFQTGGVKSFIQGLREGSISMSGMFEQSLGGVENAFGAAFQGNNDDGFLVFPDGGTATATGGPDFRCHLAQVVETKYDIKSPVAGVVAIDMEATADGGVWNGVGQYLPATVLTGAGTFYTAASLTSAGTGSSNGGQLHLGVLSLSGTSPTISVQLQHSQTGSSWVPATGGPEGVALTSLGSSIQILTGTIYSYTRLAVTLGGTSPSAVVYYGFARY
jgi:hypothetical protein